MEIEILLNEEKRYYYSRNKHKRKLIAWEQEINCDCRNRRRYEKMNLYDML